MGRALSPIVPPEPNLPPVQERSKLLRNFFNSSIADPFRTAQIPNLKIALQKAGQKSP
jgi:hypothetical protein